MDIDLDDAIEYAKVNFENYATPFDFATLKYFKELSMLRQRIEAAEKQDPACWDRYDSDRFIGNVRKLPSGAYKKLSRYEPLYALPPTAELVWIPIADLPRDNPKHVVMVLADYSDEPKCIEFHTVESLKGFKQYTYWAEPMLPAKTNKWCKCDDCKDISSYFTTADGKE